MDTKQAFLNCKNIDLDRGQLAKIFSFFLLKKISLKKMFCDSFDKKQIKILKILILHGHQKFEFYFYFFFFLFVFFFGIEKRFGDMFD